MRPATCLLVLSILSAACSAAGDHKPQTTTLTFLGCAAAMPAVGEDSASFIINGTLLIDCGWNVALTMRRHGHDPLRIETLFVTHFHHDHYMGLPGLMFYRGMRNAELKGRPPIQIVGPADDLAGVVDLGKRFLQADRFPVVWPAVELRPLEPGQAFETDACRIQTIKALHPVTGFCSRFTDKKTGIVIAFSGDTAPNPALATLAAHADLLIHEASISPKTPDGKVGPDHSRAIDAARIAREAGVRQLKLIHTPSAHRQASLAAAREIFPQTSLAAEGETLTLAPE